MKNFVSALLIFAVCCGCGRSQGPAPVLSPSESPATAPADVMVSVNGETLTRSTLERDVDIRLAAELRKGLAEPALQQARRKATINVVDQFVKRELLLAQAELTGIQISESEENQAFDKIRIQVEQAGNTLEEVMASSPLGADKMREEVLVGLKISKYLARALTNTTEVSEAELDDFKQRYRDQLVTPETVKASHILITVDEADTDEAKVTKRAHIDDLRQQLLAGTNFADLAREFSDCPSRQQGGYLGVFPRGQMVKPFEDAAFSQTPGEIGPVVETRFGYHVILITAHDQNSILPDERIREGVIKEKRQNELITLLNALKAQSKITYSDSIMKMMQP